MKRGYPYTVLGWIVVILCLGSVGCLQPLSAQPPLAAGWDGALGCPLLAYDTISPHTFLHGEIGLTAEVRGTFFNAEYFHPLALGYTLPGGGMFIGGEVHLGKRASARVGGRLRMLGNKGHGITVWPVVQLTVEPLRGFTMTLGELPYAAIHGLPDFLYELPWPWIEGEEFGARLAYRGTRIQVESWIDWENFIWIGAREQERFLVGIQGGYLPQQAWIPHAHIVALAHHRGGQIDSAYLPVQTQWNFALQIGARTPTWWGDKAWAGWRLWGASSHCELPTASSDAQPLTWGWLIAPRAYLSLYGAWVEIGYAWGQRFQSLRGQSLYNAWSHWLGTHSGFLQRSVLTVSTGWEKRWWGCVMMGGEATLFYDTFLKKVDWHFALNARMAFSYLYHKEKGWHW